LSGTMINICFYVSDYGYGHAARDIAIIRRISNTWRDAKIYVKTDYPFKFVRQSLPQKNVEVIKTKNDIGVVFKKNSTVVDKESTKEMLDGWVSSWDDYIQREREFCKVHGIDLILSDITPQPFIVADELGLPSIGISNFTWYYIFFNLFGRTEATERIKKAYRCAEMALVLPFNEEMDVFKKRKEISLVSREITADRRTLRRMHGISDDDLLVYVGVGKSFNPLFLNDLKVNSGVKLLVSSDVELASTIKIPSSETETQNYIAICDLVVSKAGYSTVSEAIRAKVPMLLFKREGYREDELIVNGVEKLGIGRESPERSFLDGNWINEVDDLDRYSGEFDTLDGRFKKDGTLEIIDAIREMIP